MEKTRRYDLDWLRVIVFGLLIFYHVGMFFVPWGFHIKNNVIYDWIRWPMLFLNQWRLPILFMISGMGTYFALSFRSGKQFILERNKRLGIPLLFGMLVIIPPQVYVERLVQMTFSGSYWSFWTGEAFNGIYPEGNFSWHHLWFLPYLFTYSILLTPIFLWLRSNAAVKFLTRWGQFLERKPFGIYLMAIPLFLYESLLEPFFPITHNLVSDWFNFISSLTLFLFGYLLIAIKDNFWSTVSKIRFHTFLIGILTFTSLIIRWVFFEDSVTVHFIEAFLKITNLWSWILTIFGYAAKYLNRPSRGLKYCNQAVYPFYILHQTVMLIIGYLIMDLDWPFAPKFLIMVLGTFMISWALYEFLIRRLPPLKPLFGLKR